jgi:ribosomal protein S18 acetylase RimI-like enzyme
LRRTIPFKIRVFQKKDKTALPLLFKSCFSHQPFLEKWTLPAAQKRVSQILADPQVVGWVATVFSTPVGFSFLQVRQGAQESYGELLETAVHPYFQNQGIEQALLKSVRQFQKHQKIKNVMVLAFRGKHEKLFKSSGWLKSKRSVVYVSR